MNYYRLMSSLPALPEVPEAPPMALEAVIENVMPELDESDRPLAMALLGYLDCCNVEAMLQGRDLFDQRAVLSRESLEDREDLPGWLADFLESYDAGAIADPYPFDALWRAFYGNLVQVADTTGSEFLQDWSTFEITLRDALVQLRAEDLGEKADLRTSGLHTEQGESHLALLSAFNEASDPMEAERVLDAARLKKIRAISGIDPFSTDAVLAYVTAMLILDRWDLSKKADMATMLEVFA